MQPETVGAVLAAAMRRLAAAGSPTPQLDARLLLEAAAGLSREEMILEPARRLEPSALSRFEDLLIRRARHEPVSRILGEREFYGRRFRVTPAVLDPRPDTETLVEAALRAMPAAPRILDLGTGSGAIIVTLLAERPDAAGVAVDLSPDALAVAAMNAQASGVMGRLTLLEGSWFTPVTGSFDLIVSNPPYIGSAAVAGLDPDVREHDPLLALDGGPDGLAAYRAIAREATSFLKPDGMVMVEIGAGQADDVAAIFADAGFVAAGRFADLAGHIRCLAFQAKKLVGNPLPSG